MRVKWSQGISDSGMKPDRLWRAVGSGDGLGAVDAVDVQDLLVSCLSDNDQFLEVSEAGMGFALPAVLVTADVVLDGVLGGLDTNVDEDAFVIGGEVKPAADSVDVDTGRFTGEGDGACRVKLEHGRNRIKSNEEGLDRASSSLS